VANRIYPNNVPNPVTPLGSDGADFRAILVDSTGKPLVVASNLTDLGGALQSVGTDFLRVYAGYNPPAYGPLAIDSQYHVQTDILGLPGKNTYNNVLIGYNAVYGESLSDLNATAGTVMKTGSVVPAGEIWYVTNTWSLNNTTSVRMQHKAQLKAQTHYIRDITAPGVGVVAGTQGNWLLVPGDYMIWVWLSCVLGDDLYWGASGYKIKTA